MTGSSTGCKLCCVSAVIFGRENQLETLDLRKMTCWCVTYRIPTIYERAGLITRRFLAGGKACRRKSYKLHSALRKRPFSSSKGQHDQGHVLPQVLREGFPQSTWSKFNIESPGPRNLSWIDSGSMDAYLRAQDLLPHLILTRWRASSTSCHAR